MALLLALLRAMFGPGLQNTASAGSAPPTDACDPNSGWRWTSGPSRPDLAQQAEQALRQAGLESTVLANEYGEQNSCGDFHPFSVDFTVNLQGNTEHPVAPDRKAEQADRVLSTLRLLAAPRLGNVRLFSAEGDAIPVDAVQEPLTVQAPAETPPVGGAIGAG